MQEGLTVFAGFNHNVIAVASFAVTADQWQLAAEYGISSIPCLVVLKNGQESARSVGFLPKQALQDMLDKYI